MNEICSICQIQILSTEDIKICGICKTKYHLECWNEISGCATFQCANNTNIDYPEEENILDVQKGIKTCPMCGETISIDLKTCPYCYEHFDTTAPISQEEIKNKYSKIEIIILEKKGATWIFIISLFGITAPFNLIFGISWYIKNKQKLIESSPTYNLLALIGFIISGFYIILFLIAIILNT